MLVSSRIDDNNISINLQSCDLCTGKRRDGANNCLAPNDNHDDGEAITMNGGNLQVGGAL